MWRTGGGRVGKAGGDAEHDAPHQHPPPAAPQPSGSHNSHSSDRPPSGPLLNGRAAAGSGSASASGGGGGGARLTHKRSVSDVVPALSAGGVERGYLSDGAEDSDVVSFAAAAAGDRERERDRERGAAAAPFREGVVAKWTNYFHGWQERYLVLQNGTIAYFKSERDKHQLCRGSLDLAGASIRPHKFDPLRFDVVMGDQFFYIRVESTQLRDDWVSDLIRSKGTRMRRRPSTLSLASYGSGATGHSGEGDSLAAIKRELQEHIAQLQEQVDGLSRVNGGTVLEREKACIQVKATASTVQAAVDECLELLKLREAEWKNKCATLKQRYEEAVRSESTHNTSTIYGHPDMEEGPHSVLNDEEFFDALEIGLDQLEAEAEAANSLELEETVQESKESSKWHKIAEEKVQESLRLANEPTGDLWQSAHQEGDLKVYRRGVDEKGETTDRLKAFHRIDGVSARELCQYFYDPKLKMEWEHTIEKFHVVERVDDKTNITHNIHKRVWPSAQRDSLLLSHLKRLSDAKWVVQNTSVEHDKVPQTDKFVRLTVYVTLMAETYVREGAKAPFSRADFGCNVTYLAYVHPGGWAPPSVVAYVSMREYPKFLKNLEAQAKRHFKSLEPEL